MLCCCHLYSTRVWECIFKLQRCGVQLSFFWGHFSRFVFFASKSLFCHWECVVWFAQIPYIVLFSGQNGNEFVFSGLDDTKLLNYFTNDVFYCLVLARPLNPNSTFKIIMLTIVFVNIQHVCLTLCISLFWCVIIV